MSKVSIRELRNEGGEVIDRVLAGEVITVTRAGAAVAVLRPADRPGIDRLTLLRRWRHLPPLDPAEFRRDIDQTLDATL